jgi:hypothetical protein
MAMPARGMSLAQFQADDALCQQYAASQIGSDTPARAANDSAAGSALLGTILGAAAGAAIGAAAGDPAMGAAVGAGGGLLMGGASGARNAQDSAAEVQDRYDMRYLQCMAARGQSVPVPQGYQAYSNYPPSYSPGSYPPGSYPPGSYPPAPYSGYQPY